ncbi:MAG: hypothetical protein U0871_19805 [Gemmataceae bacterium]
MFSFSEYVRRLARDAALAGIYDALELLESPGAHDPSQAAELFVAKIAGPPEPPASPPPPPAVTVARPPSLPPRPHLPSPTGESLEARKRGRPPKGPEGSP